MSLPPSGDSGEGPGDGSGEEHDDDELDDPFEDGVGFRRPLPPEDRIWRHPSEVAGPAAPGTSEPRPARTRRGPAIALVAGLVGAALAAGVIAAVDGFGGGTRVVERHQAVQPVTSVAADDDSVAAITSRTAPSVAGVYVTREGEGREGSAIVVRSDGHLVTNAHLVAGADRVEVRIHGQEVRRAEVVGTDDATDLAVLHVDVDGLEPAAMGSAEHLRAGDAVIALGHAHGTRTDASVEQSVVSELDQRLRMPSGTVLHGMILLDTPLPDGAAGGPLVDGAGAVIGVTSAVPAADGGDGGDGDAAGRAYGVATPAEVALHAAEHLIEHGRVQHVWLGIEGTDLRPAEAADLGVAGGASVEDVIADSPAAAAGLAPDDVVVEVNDAAVASMSEVIAALRTHDPGDTVALTLRRGDDEVRTSAVLAPKDR